MCGGCHPKQYANEMAGPHANAYAKLMVHIDQTRETTYPHRFYSSFIAQVESSCAYCHSSSNVFETYFTSIDDATPRIMEPNKSFPLPIGRSDSTSFLTGVDCLTCHFDGKKVIAGASFSPKPNISQASTCAPMASKVLSSDLGCMPCHPDNRVSDSDLYYSGLQSGSTCISCHEEKDASGTGTHYYYWKYDSEQRTSKNPLLAFYAPREVSIEGNNVLVRWKNELLPHAIGQCPEMVINIGLSGRDGHVDTSVDLRFNRRDYYGNKMVNFFGANVLPGISGFMPVLNHTDTLIRLPIGVLQKSDSIKVSVTGLSKTQYWHHDSTGIVRFRRVYPLR